jgi:signal recognition particle subunit SRP54
VLSLVEQVEQNVDREKAQKLAEKVIKGKRFDMNDMRDQLQQMLSMGGLSSMLDKLPGAANLSDQVKSKVNDKEVHRMVAIINSMTKKERRHPDVLNGSRKARVARGSGTQPADVNRLLKQYMQMEKMMSKLSSGGIKGLMRQMGAAMKGMGGGGLPPGGMPGR